MSRKTLHRRSPRGGAGLVRPLHLFCVLLLSDVGCRVYNAELVDDHHIVHFETAGAGANAADANDSMQQISDQTADKLPACGNARVDDTERCDIAIPSGQPGACPQACDSGDPCVRQRLAGQRCAARCESAEITVAADGDGCCPAGATIQSDHDCSASCGNGVLEAPETCDPPSSCPQSEACVSSDVCMAAQFTGSASLCSARCELQPITACKSDDGCCPSGCSAEQDSDCIGVSGGGSISSAAGSGNPSTSTLPDAGTTHDGGADSSTAADSDPISCQTVHAGGRCESCDCTYCADGVSSCFTGSDPVDGAACKAVVDCAALHHCNALDCLCGVSSLNQCERYPLGACRDEILALAGTSDPLSAVADAADTSTGIGRAVSMLSCRSDHCGGVCGL